MITRLPADVWRECIGRDVENRWWVPLVAASLAGPSARRAYLWLRMVATRTVPASCPECGDVVWRPLRYTGEFDPPYSLMRKRRVEYCKPEGGTSRCQHRAEVRRRRRRQARAADEAGVSLFGRVTTSKKPLEVRSRAKR